MLNQVDSPNYGRYELVSVEDVGDYVMMIVDPKLGQGTILEGDKVAFQAFPKAGGTGDSLWTDVGGVPIAVVLLEMLPVLVAIFVALVAILPVFVAMSVLFSVIASTLSAM